MNRIHEGLDDKDFDMPSSVEKKPASAQRQDFSHVPVVRP